VVGAYPTLIFDGTPIPTSRLGDCGPGVRQVQEALIQRGYDLVADGEFGPRTDAAVRDWQAIWRLEVDGIVGPATWRSFFVDGCETPSGSDPGC
jgi:peptidoglycan hydrolase-like protein with peptidoglycan-binding domain